MQPFQSIKPRHPDQQPTPLPSQHPQSLLYSLPSLYHAQFDFPNPASLLNKRPNPYELEHEQSSLHKRLKTLPVHSTIYNAPYANPMTLQFAPQYSHFASQGMLNQELLERMGRFWQQKVEDSNVQMITPKLEMLAELPSQLYEKKEAASGKISSEVEGKNQKKLNKISKDFKGKVEKLPLEQRKTGTTDTANDGKSRMMLMSPIEGQKMSARGENEPILFEYTRLFPDWDLSTIFHFIKSGKSKIDFEKERKNNRFSKSKNIKHEAR